jgi:hydrogenase maturation protease
LLASKRLEEEVQKAAVVAAEGIGTGRPAAPPPRVVAAGRPGAGLLDLLPEDGPCLLMDVVCSGAPPGTVHRIPLRELNPAVLPDLRTSSHGFGPGEALALGRALGRRIPEGYFLGIEGASFGPGEPLSAAVERGVAELLGAALETVEALAR